MSTALFTAEGHVSSRLSRYLRLIKSEVATPSNYTSSQIYVAEIAASKNRNSTRVCVC